MLGILLVGHPELEKKLNRFDACAKSCSAPRSPACARWAQTSHLPAAARQRREYKLDEFITPDGVDELRSRLTVKGPGQTPQ